MASNSILSLLVFLLAAHASPCISSSHFFCFSRLNTAGHGVWNTRKVPTKLVAKSSQSSGLSLDYCREDNRKEAALSAARAAANQGATSGAGSGTSVGATAGSPVLGLDSILFAGKSVVEEESAQLRGLHMTWLRRKELIGDSKDAMADSLINESALFSDADVSPPQSALFSDADVRSGGDAVGQMRCEDSQEGGGQGGGGVQLDTQYVSSLKAEVDNLVAQQRVGIAWTRFLRSVERRSR